MLQTAFYIAVIVLAVIGTVAIIAFTIISLILFKKINAMINQARTGVNTVTESIEQIGDKGQAFLSQLQTEGGSAATTSKVLTSLFTGYFFLRSFLKHRR